MAPGGSQGDELEVAEQQLGTRQSTGWLRCPCRVSSLGDIGWKTRAQWDAVGGYACLPPRMLVP